MDLVRSCYSALVRFREDEPATLVKWFFCNPGAEIFTAPTIFRSANWESDGYTNEGLGEQRPQRRPWSNGATPTGMDGHPGGCIFPASWWVDGIPARTMIELPRSTSGAPLCCAFGLGGIFTGGFSDVTPRPGGRKLGGIFTGGKSTVVVHHYLGGPSEGGFSDVEPHPPPVQMCCPGLAGDLLAVFPFGQGCPCLDGESVLLVQVEQLWTGFAVVCDDELLTLTLHCEGLGVDSWRLDASFENHGVVVNLAPQAGGDCDPFLLVFTGINWPVQGVECDGACSVVIIPN